MLRISLSSDAAASLATALHRVALRAGSLEELNQTVAASTPPDSISSWRTIRAEGIVNPTAALAIVLAKLILARSSVMGGRL
jgi:hypothetical protein